MPAAPVRRPVRALLVALSLVLAGTVMSVTTQAQAVQPPSRRDTNPTGTASGSLANGLGNLKVSLAPTADGRIRVTWVRPGRARNFKRFVVRVGPSRQTDAGARSYRFGPKRQSAIVPRAIDTSPASGNYSFVKVIAHRKKGKVGGSPAKWIQAPITSGCTAAPQDRVTVAAFNVRTWAADRHLGPSANWTLRGKNVISEILRSGARAIAIQEASGSPNLGWGARQQNHWILEHLNAADPSAQWVDALDDSAYRPPAGRRPGLVGIRVFYDATRFTKLASGLYRIVDPGSIKDSLIPWARLQSVSGDQAPFVLTSNHLRVGEKNGQLEWNIRARQAAKTIAFHRELRAKFGDQVILAGDLNSTSNTRPYNQVHRVMMAAGFYDAYATTNIVGGQYSTTTESRFPLYRTPLRRDYILTLGSAKGSCSYRNQVYHSKAEVASDHFMQVAVVPLPPLG